MDDHSDRPPHHLHYSPSKNPIDAEWPLKRAVVDFGSNSFKMTIYGRRSTDEKWQRLDAYENSVKLAHGVHDGHLELSKGAIRRAYRTAKAFGDILKEEGITDKKAYITATGRAIRNTEQGKKFIATLELLSDLKIFPVSGRREAQFAIDGVEEKIPEAEGVGAGTGGGSTQTGRIGRGPKKYTSIQEGIITVKEAGDNDPAKMRRRFKRKLKHGHDYGEVHTAYLMGTAWRAAFKAYMTQITGRPHEHKAVHNTTFLWREVRKELIALSEMKAHYFRHSRFRKDSGKKVPLMSSEVRLDGRPEMMRAGIVTLVAILDHLNPRAVVIPNTNTRDGACFRHERYFARRLAWREEYDARMQAAEGDEVIKLPKRPRVKAATLEHTCFRNTETKLAA